MSAAPHNPLGNRLLAALPGEDYQRLLPHLHPVSFSLGEVVYESGGHMDYIYFPTTSIVSLLYTTVDGATAEMGMVGSDGVAGIATRPCSLDFRNSLRGSQLLLT